MHFSFASHASGASAQRLSLNAGEACLDPQKDQLARMASEKKNLFRTFLSWTFTNPRQPQLTTTDPILAPR